MIENFSITINGVPITVTAGMRWLYETRDRALGRRHCNAQYEAATILRGVGHADVTDQQYDLQPGQGIIIAPGRFHFSVHCPEILSVSPSVSPCRSPRWPEPSAANCPTIDCLPLPRS